MVTYGTYFDGASARAHPVNVAEDGRLLIFSGDEVPQTLWDVRGLHAIDPPSPGQPYRLTHESKPGARLIITDRDFVAELIKKSRHLRGGYSSRDILHLLGWTFGGIAFFAVLGWVAISVLPAPIAHLLPQNWRDRTGQEMEAAMTQGSRQCSTAASDRAFGQLLAAFAEGEPDIPPVSIHVYDLPVINAFALSGGRIVVTRRLIDAADRPEELAGVLAHEIGHVAHLDPEAQMVRLTGVGILASVFSGSNGGNFSSNAVLTASVLRHSREAETAADAYAQDILDKAHIDPMGLKTFFQKLLKQEGQQKSNIPALDALGSILSNHPGTEQRLETIKPLPEGDVARPALSVEDWKAVKAICG